MEKLLSQEFMAKSLLKEASYAKSHGVISGMPYLGTAILYYAIAYMLPAVHAVVLGSGAGFVPRLVRQAQREIPEGEFAKQSRCLLIDADQEIAGFGRPEYHGTQPHFFKEAYPDIEILKMTTDEAFLRLKGEGFKIDYLHIDADHTFFQSFSDFENYLSLMKEEFVITLHDTAIHHYEMAYDGCVPRTVATLRRLMRPGGAYDHLEMINFNNRYKNSAHPFKGEMTCAGTAIIKPKTLSFWDDPLFG